MPIDYNDYCENWRALSEAIRFGRAGGKCEGSPGFYSWCRAEHGKQHPITGSTVVLTVAHLDHDVSNNMPSNLRAMCQRCHLTYDAKHHARNAAETRRKREQGAGQLAMF